MKVDVYKFERSRLHWGYFSSKGSLFKAHAGAWNFYVPSLKLKLAYARNGMIHCLHRKTPDIDQLFAGKWDGDRIGRYSSEEWKSALSKSTRRRAAENYLSAQRLHIAGLGPKPLGICYVRNFSCKLFGDWSETAGIMIEDINQLPAKSDATEEQIIAAGVTVDSLKSCVRQQIKGYVSDLNSVVGVMPVDAEEEIEAILKQLSGQVG